MVESFQVIILIIIVVSFLGSVGEKRDKRLRNNLTALCLASIIAFTIITWFLN